MGLNKKLAAYNPPDYILTKTLEEMNELGTLLTQRLNKKGSPKEPTNEQIAEELGDLEIRIKILKHHIGKDLVKKRVELKSTAYKRYLEEKKYPTI